MVVKMLKKKLGIEAIERNWNLHYHLSNHYFKIPSILVIPEGCEMIGNFAFYECNRLKEVVISKSVEVIRFGAFEYCGRLEKVVIPRNVEVIGSIVFYYCSNAVIILKKPRREFKFIAPDAFSDCRDVKEEVWT